MKRLAAYLQLFGSGGDCKILFLQHSPECARKGITDLIHISYQRSDKFGLTLGDSQVILDVKLNLTYPR